MRIAVLLILVMSLSSVAHGKRPFRTKPIPVSESRDEVERTTIGDLHVDNLVARKIVLADDNGKPRLTMNIDQQNTVRLTISNGSQSAVAMLNVFEDGRTAFILRGPRGRNRVSISTRQSGQPTIYMSEDANIILANDKNQPRLGIGNSTEGGTRFFYYNQQGKIVELIESSASQTSQE